MAGSKRIFTIVMTLALLLSALSAISPRPTSASFQSDEAAPFDVLQLIPGSATALVTLNTDPDSEQWPIAAANLKTAGMEDFIYGSVAQLFESAELTPSLIDPDQSTLLGGSVTLATWGDGENPIANAAVYVLASDPHAAYQTLVATVITDVQSEIQVYPVPGGEASTAGSGPVVMLLGDVVVAASSTTADHIARLVGGAEPTLAEFKPFNKVMDQQDAGAIARAYLNGPGIGNQLGPLLIDMFGLSFSELGLLLSVAGPLVTAQSSLGLVANASGFHLKLAQLPAPFIGQPLPGDGPGENLATRVSADTTFFAAGQDLGTNQILNQLISIILPAIALGTASDSSEDANPLEQFEDLTGIDLQEQLLDQLRGDYYLAVSAPAIESPNDLAGVLVSDVEDPTVIDGLLRLARLGLTLGAADDFEELSWTTEDVEGGSLLVLSVAGLIEPISVSIGLINDQLVVAYGDGYATLLSPADDASLVDTPRFQQAQNALPESDAALAYLDLAQVITLSDLTALEPTDVSVLPDGPQLASLDGIESIVSSTYEQDGLAITDFVLVLETQRGRCYATSEPGPRHRISRTDRVRRLPCPLGLSHRRVLPGR